MKWRLEISLAQTSSTLRWFWGLLGQSLKLLCLQQSCGICWFWQFALVFSPYFVWLAKKKLIDGLVVFLWEFMWRISLLPLCEIIVFKIKNEPFKVRFFWCRRWESNPHEVALAGFRVFQQVFYETLWIWNFWCSHDIIIILSVKVIYYKT